MIDAAPAASAHRALASKGREIAGLVSRRWRCSPASSAASIPPTELHQSTAEATQLDGAAGARWRRPPASLIG
jgi:hypothetical protein